MEIRIYIASTIPYDFPKDKVYIPISVGKCDSENIFSHIDQLKGENIFHKSKTYCELTALYWIWKNDVKADYLGLCHYRRYFARKRFGKKKDRILSGADVERIFYEQADAVIVPRRRNYIFDTLYSHYSNTHDESHLIAARAILSEKFPEFLNSFDSVMKHRSAFMFNMFIMRRDYIDAYCRWIFDVLGALEERIDTTNMSAFDARLFGRISELLFNVWIEKNGCNIFETGYVNLSKTKWIKKITAYILAKFFGKKLDRSY